MEINQAAQTFLFFFIFFIASLLGFAFYIKQSQKLSKISIANAVQTSILIAGMFTLLVLAGSYYFVLSDVVASQQPLKDALSITASFFGGFSTLIAAYIASRLFNDWRYEKDHDTKSIYLNNAIQKLSEIHSSLIESRSNAHNLLKIEDYLILKMDYLNQMSMNHKKTLILLHADLTVVSKLFERKLLIEEYSAYEKLINVFNMFNELLSKEYGRYYHYYIDTYLSLIHI